MAKRKKEKTWAQVEAAQAKAVRFLRDVVGDDEKADEIESLSPGEYAERKKFIITNPAPPTKSKPKGEAAKTRPKQRSSAMPEETSPYANMTKAELIEELERRDEAEDEIWTDGVLAVDDGTSADDAIETIAEILNDLDPERFPYEDDGDEAEGQDDQGEAA